MKLPDAKTVALAGGWIVACASFVAGWEGYYPRPYRDIVGVLTVCYGETEGIKATDNFTKEQCKSKLALKLPRYWFEIERCMGPAVVAKLTDNMKVAFTSGAYNFGSGAFCKSSIVRRLKAGDYEGACEALLAFNRAGGRVVRGLVNRRNAEYEVCMKGVPT